ncbi:hypothetical protein MMC07_002550, partial [Pseudocyphellaria aurata]|nr:hypothetical protein [Pseudocyphellaria aurata]
ASERAADVAKKGYAGVLEADLWRSEAKMEALRRDSATKPARQTQLPSRGSGRDDMTGRPNESDHGEDERIDDDGDEEAPRDKEDGLQMWREEMAIRFLAGRDEDFDYTDVDAGQEGDGSEEEREEEEKWFNDEEESWLGEEERGEEGGHRGEDHLKPVLKGETGVQDF